MYITQMHANIHDFMVLCFFCTIFGMFSFFGKIIFPAVLSKKNYRHLERQPFSSDFLIIFFKFFFACSVAGLCAYGAWLFWGGVIPPPPF
jgi:hypothetical protein